MSDAEPPSRGRGRAGTAAAYGLVLVLALLVAVWGSFLVPLRWGGTLVPVSWLIVAVGNVGLGRVGGRLLGRPGAVGTGLVWAAVALTLGSQRSEGDLVIPGTWPGLGYLLVGTVASAVAFGATPRDRA